MSLYGVIMSEITKEMHRLSDRIKGSDARTFTLLNEQWNILLNAHSWAMRTGYRLG
jgi:hypothetical protein